jgi:hypothetical protein
MRSLISAVAISTDTLATAAGCLLVYYAFTGRWPWE